jgi:hypothetical protein
VQKSETKTLRYKEREVQNSEKKALRYKGEKCKKANGRIYVIKRDKCKTVKTFIEPFFFSSSKVLLVDASVYADIQWMRAIFRLKRKENSSQILGNVSTT